MKPLVLKRQETVIVKYGLEFVFNHDILSVLSFRSRRRGIPFVTMPSRARLYYVYIMASSTGTLYVGVTNSIYKRVLQHQEGTADGFTKKFAVNRLVYFEVFHYIGVAIAREKEIKAWRRSKKVALIDSANPSWRDLSKDFGKEFKPEKSSWE